MASASRGTVIIAALWASTLMMWAGLELSGDMRLAAEEQALRERRGKALYLAVGGAYEAMGRLVTASLDGDDDQGWQPDGTIHLIKRQTGKVVVYAEVETAKVSTVNTEPDEMANALRRGGLPIRTARELAALARDFIDGDDSPLEGGAEASDYKALGLDYRPANGPLLGIDQFLLLPGMSLELFYHGTGKGSGASKDPDDILLDGLPAPGSPFSLLTAYVAPPPTEADVEEQPGDAASNPDTDQDAGQDTAMFTGMDSKGAAGGAKDRSGLSPDGQGQEDDLGQTEPKAERGGVYRIVAAAMTDAGPPVVTICIIIRLEPAEKTGYEVLYRSTL